MKSELNQPSTHELRKTYLQTLLRNGWTWLLIFSGLLFFISIGITIIYWNALYAFIGLSVTKNKIQFPLQMMVTLGVPQTNMVEIKHYVQKFFNNSLI